MCGVINCPSHLHVRGIIGQGISLDGVTRKTRFLAFSF